jgi:hypothetical protein
MKIKTILASLIIGLTLLTSCTPDPLPTQEDTPIVVIDTTTYNTPPIDTTHTDCHCFKVISVSPSPGGMIGVEYNCSHNVLVHKWKNSTNSNWKVGEYHCD